MTAAVRDDVEDRPALGSPGVGRGRRRPPAATPSSSSSRGPPTWTVEPSTTARAPRPASASKPVAGGGAMPAARQRRARSLARAGARSRPRPRRRAGAASASSTPSAATTSASDRLALGERAGLVEDDRVELAGPLEGDPVLDEQPVAGAERGRDRDDQRDREAQRVGAGDDEDRRGPHERILGVAEQPPADERDGAGGERDVEQERRPPGRRAPAPATPMPGPRRPCRMIPDRAVASPVAVTRDPERSAGGDGPGDDRDRRAPWRPRATRR